ncbi:MAG: hypothetical protein ABIJ18_03835 [archaeon]
MDPNNYDTIEDFVRALERANQIIEDQKPDCIIAPMFGSVPFIDVMNVINDNFPNEKVQYVPASNKVHRLREVLRSVFENVINNVAPHGGSFLSIDEVISGNSLKRVYKQFDAARTNYANIKTKEFFGPSVDFREENVQAYRDAIKDSISYKTIGIVDSKLQREGKELNETYQSLLEQKIVIPIETTQIVTMDRVGFFPAKYRMDKDSEGKRVYLPVVDEFNISQEYIDFLHVVSEILGKNRDSVTVRNMGKIRDSYRLVPEELRKL